MTYVYWSVKLDRNLNRCLVQEISNRDESLRIPFIPLKDSPLYVDCGSFVADAGKLMVVLQTKGDAGYYETVVSNALQKSAMRRSGKPDNLISALQQKYTWSRNSRSVPPNASPLLSTPITCGAAALYCP